MVSRYAIWLPWVALATACGGSTECTTDDACEAGLRCERATGTCVPAIPDASMTCANDAECDDGAFCNGDERCDPAGAGADADGCVAGASPCAVGEMCAEADDTCALCADGDADGDGHASELCGGDDCDDADANRFPGSTEVCDDADHDEDCDDATFGIRDLDIDGEPDVRCCNGASCGTDCDDTRAGVSPRVAEVCDGLDNDCDGSTDEGVTTTYYEDGDGDGHGSRNPAATAMTACSPPPSFSARNDDCDDADAAVNPGTPERCSSAADDDCDDVVNEDCTCTSGSRACPHPGACAAGTQTCVTGEWADCSIQPASETCNRVDEDCDAQVDEFLTVVCFADADDDGFAAMGTVSSDECPNAARTTVGGCPSNFTNRAPSGAGNVDCGEGDASVFPGAIELCDTIDQNCDGDATAGATIACYPDPDRDGYAAVDAVPVDRCGCGVNHTERRPVGTSNIDCVPNNANRNPAAAEQCNGVDDDCDSLIDDSPGFQCAQGETQSCMMMTCGTSGMRMCNPVSCLWNACAATEVCNGCDDDGAGGADDTFACAQGTVVSGCTHCGIAGGTRTCATDCSGMETCRHAIDVTCNYCDDDRDGRWDEDATTMTVDWPPLSSEACNERTLPSGTASMMCVGTAGDTADPIRRVLVNDYDEIGAVRFQMPSNVSLGYGELELTVQMWSRLRVDGETPRDGWAVVMYLGAAPAALGSSGVQLGVDRTRRGYAMEWRFYAYSSDSVFTPTANSPDALGIRMMTGTGDGTYLPASASATTPLDSTSGSCNPGCFVAQNVVVRLRADDPDTATVNEMYVRMRQGGVLVASCEGAACLEQLTPGDTVQFGVVAATSATGRAAITQLTETTSYTAMRSCP